MKGCFLPPCLYFVLQFSPEHERHIREHEYLADILSDWEE